MSLVDDARSVLRPWREAPARQASIAARCYVRALVPTAENNNFRKVTTTLLFATWAAVTLGDAYGVASIDTVQYGVLSAVVFSIIGEQWGIELSRFGNGDE
jgi:hypothetical protein